MNIKRMIFFALLCAGVFIGYSIATRTKTERDSDTLTIGTAAGYAPFVSINPQGEYEGFDIDCAQAIATSLNKKLILKDLGSMTSLIIALEQGTIDAIMWGMSITADRAQKFGIVHYQGTNSTSNSLISAKEFTRPINSLADLKNMVICVEPTSSQASLLEKQADITLMPMDNVDNALLAIRYHKADAAFLDPIIAQKFKRRYPDLILVDIPLDPEDSIQGVGIIIKKTNNSLMDLIQQAISTLKNNGTLKRYESKWGIE